MHISIYMYGREFYHFYSGSGSPIDLWVMEQGDIVTELSEFGKSFKVLAGKLGVGVGTPPQTSVTSIPYHAKSTFSLLMTVTN